MKNDKPESATAPMSREELLLALRKWSWAIGLVVVVGLVVNWRWIMLALNGIGWVVGVVFDGVPEVGRVVQIERGPSGFGKAIPAPVLDGVFQ